MTDQPITTGPVWGIRRPDGTFVPMRGGTHATSLGVAEAWARKHPEMRVESAPADMVAEIGEPTPGPLLPGPVLRKVPRRVNRRPRQRDVWPADDPRGGDPKESPSRDGSIPEPRVAELRSMPYADYLKTPEWDARRLGKILSAGQRCQVCNSRGDLEVHHRTYERRGVERWMDLIVLCGSCHGLFHAHGKLADPAEEESCL